MTSPATTSPEDEVATLIRDSAAAYVEQEDTVRRARLRAEAGFDHATWAGMAALGWTGMLASEDAGGGGLGLGAAAVLQEELGRGLAPEPLVLGAHLPLLALDGASGPAAAGLVAAIIAGEGPCPLVWQGRSGALSAEDTAIRLEAGRLTGEARHVSAAGAASALLVAARAPDGVALYRVAADAPGLRRATLHTADGNEVSHLVLDGVAVGADDLVAPPGLGGRLADRALDGGRILLAAELLGVMREALARTLDYLRTRKQFGRAVGSFQALQHRAVDLHVQVELAAAAVAAAVRAADAGAEDAALSVAASAAKARASEAALKVTREAVQLHGAIGYTTEHDTGLFLNHALTLAAALGSAAVHRRRYGRLLVRAA